MTDSRDRLGVALVGAGAIAVRAHLPAWRARPDVLLRWVVDSRLETAEAIARKFGIPRWSASIADVLADPETDAVDLCTPAGLHAQQAVAALSAGKHVLIEKPAAVSVSDGEAVIAAASASGTVCAVAENWIYASATQRVRRLIDEGTIGRPFMLQGSNESDFLLLPFSRPDQTDRDRLGYGFVGGVHTLAVARYLMGEVAQIQAFANVSGIVTGLGVPYDRDMVIACRFASGAIGSMHFTGRSRQPGRGIREFRVFGSRGRAEFDVVTGRCEWSIENEELRVDESVASAGHPEAVADFVSSIREQRKPLAGIVDQLETLRLLYAAYAAAAQTAVGSVFADDLDPAGVAEREGSPGGEGG